MTAPAAPLVFIVDDDSSVRRSLARLVRAAGFERRLRRRNPLFGGRHRKGGGAPSEFPRRQALS